MSGSQKSRATITMKTRLEILDQLDEGTSVGQTATIFGISPVSVRRIRQNAIKIRRLMEHGTVANRKKMRGPKYKNVDNELIKWVIERKALGDKVTDVMIQEKATELVHELYGLSTYKASKAWIWRFKKRYQIHQSLYNGKIDADMAAEKFVRKFNRRIKKENLDMDNIYNMEVTKILWKVLPRSILVELDKKKSDSKKLEVDCVTVAFCTNTAGTHKLPPLFIHKYEKSRVLKQSRKSLPIIFKSQKNAWIDQEIFADWYNNYFKTAVRKYQSKKGVTGKVLLLVNNHKEYILPEEESTQDDHFAILFLPTNITSILQPLDQGIIEDVKRNYRYYMLKHIFDLPDGVVDFYKNYNIRDCIEILQNVWTDVKSKNIKDSWRKLLKLSSRKDDPTITDTDLKQLINNIVGKDVVPNELTEWLTLCAEAEVSPPELKSKEKENAEGAENIENTVRQMEQSEQLTPDKEEMDRAFKNLSEWAETENNFIKMYVKVLKDYYYQNSFFS